jgi:Helix-turn-helix domain
MSIRAINWALEQIGPREDVTPTMRHILVVLANYAGDEDESYPRQTTLARITGLSRVAVNQNLGKLEDVGLITATGRTHSTGATRSSVYKLHIPETKIDPRDYDKSPSGGVNDVNTRGVKQVNRGVNDDDSGCQRGLQGGVNDVDTLNHHLEPSPEPSHKPKRKRGPAALWPEDAFDTFWKRYPDKTAKKFAKKCFDKIADDGEVEFADLIAGLERYIRNKPKDRAWCHPSTFLNQGRWEDQPASANQRPQPDPRRRMAI